MNSANAYVARRTEPGATATGRLRDKRNHEPTSDCRLTQKQGWHRVAIDSNAGVSVRSEFRSFAVGAYASWRQLDCGRIRYSCIATDHCGSSDDPDCSVVSAYALSEAARAGTVPQGTRIALSVSGPCSSVAWRDRHDNGFPSARRRDQTELRRGVHGASGHVVTDTES